MTEYLDEDGFDLDGSAYGEYEEDDSYEKSYDSIFGQDSEVDEDVAEYETRSAPKKRKVRLSALNKSKLSQQEMDELFLR